MRHSPTLRPLSSSSWLSPASSASWPARAQRALPLLSVLCVVGAGVSCGAPAAEFTLRPGVESVTVTGARPGAHLELRDSDDTLLVTLIASDEGIAHFAYIPAEPLVLSSGLDAPLADGRTLKPGDGYVLVDADTAPPRRSAPFRVLAIDDVPDPSLYDEQVLDGAVVKLIGAGDPVEQGFQYVTTRDGTTLSVMVRFPDPSLYPPPWPTVIEYSGYSPSRPDSIEAGSQIATYFGYATVGVNMRGTGCSGGVFDVFNPAQAADGYDVVETIARQPWVLDHRVGMVGLSYSGIAQLYVAATRPPSLAAITPQSVIADAWEVQWPGGIYNAGFTREWLEARDSESSVGGQDWVSLRVDGGDEECARNLGLRGQNVNFESFLHGLEFRPRDADARDLRELVALVEVPVYLTGAFQDEQTGPQFAELIRRLPRKVDHRVTVFNGRHPDGYSPLAIMRWFEFLELHVARRVPHLSELVRTLGEPEFAANFDSEGLTLEPDRFADFDDDYDGALAAWRTEAPVRVLLESGAHPDEQPGAPRARAEASYDTWPPPDATAYTWFLQGDGSLGGDPPASTTTHTFAFDADAGGTAFLPDYDLLDRLWDTDWTEFAPGHLLSYLSPPLVVPSVVAGPGQVELWLSSTTPHAHVQITLSEVRPDGTEVLVQSGVLDTGHRAIVREHDDLTLERTFAVEDFSPLVPGALVPVKIALPAFAHPFRAGSQLRLTVSTPGRNHALWLFENPEDSGDVDVALSAEHPSQLVLWRVPGLEVPNGVTPCPSLRGQPCRPYRAVENSSR
ncbi:MAG: CocE/NonD family hydrolase [Deltaproteobacteria bacterium]|nr:CocE/NonD family hydrolase [Deltaproteobacteria bacterium]